jgi:hypothetical protein
LQACFEALAALFEVCPSEANFVTAKNFPATGCFEILTVELRAERTKRGAVPLFTFTFAFGFPASGWILAAPCESIVRANRLR